jgi:hypothetical protein
VIPGIIQGFLDRVVAAQGHDLGTQSFGKTHGFSQLLALAFRDGAPGAFHEEGRPGALLSFGKPFCSADQAFAAGHGVEVEQDPGAGGPWAADTMPFHVAHHGRIDPVGRHPEGHLPQRGQVAQAEEMLPGALGMLGYVDLAFTQAL